MFYNYNYKRKTFNKNDIKEGFLLELTNTVTKEKDLYIAFQLNARQEEVALINKNGKVILFSHIKDTKVFLTDLVITKVYGAVNRSGLIKRELDRNYMHELNLFDTSIRYLIYENEVLFVTEKELINLFKSQFKKEIVLI